MTHAGLAVGSAEESRGAALEGAERTAATDVNVEAAPSRGRDERLVGAADNRAASRPVTYLRIVVAARAICRAGGAAQVHGGVGLSARGCTARGAAGAKDASGWENAGRVAWSTCGHGGRRGSDAGLGAAGIAEEASGAALQFPLIAATEVKVEAAPSGGRDERLAGAADRRHGGRGSERGGGGGDRGGRRARRAGDDGDEIGDAALRQPLHRERVGRALTVVRVPRLELREAALRRLEAAGVLRHRLVDAALRVRVRLLPRRLGQLATLEQRGQVLRRALLLARAALRLVARQRSEER